MYTLDCAYGVVFLWLCGWKGLQAILEITAGPIYQELQTMGYDCGSLQLAFARCSWHDTEELFRQAPKADHCNNKSQCEVLM